MHVKKKEMKIRGTLTNAPTQLCPVCPAAQIDKKTENKKHKQPNKQKKEIRAGTLAKGPDCKVM